jgi:hypothetical protein
VFCAFLATWALASDEATLWRQRRAVSAIGAELRLHMPQSGFCVAVFEDSWLHQVDWLSDLGTTAIMTLDWPVDEARRFWAEPNLDRARPHGVSRYDRGEPLPNGKFRRAGQTFLREGKIARFLWVRTPVIGQLEIWSTDVTDDGAGAKPE